MYLSAPVSPPKIPPVTSPEYPHHIQIRPYMGHGRFLRLGKMVGDKISKVDLHIMQIGLLWMRIEQPDDVNELLHYLNNLRHPETNRLRVTDDIGFYSLALSDGELMHFKLRWF